MQSSLEPSATLHIKITVVHVTQMTKFRKENNVPYIVFEYSAVQYLTSIYNIEIQYYTVFATSIYYV